MMHEYLTRFAEPMPAWLGQLAPSDRFPLDSFFAGRFIYYPGAGLDGHPIKLFGRSRFAHCFLLVDFGFTRAEILTALNAEPGGYAGGFRGYKHTMTFELEERQLTPRGWTRHISQRHLPRQPINSPPFGIVAILERLENFDESHGPARLALMFLNADGFASYDALFCQQGVKRMPALVVLQDHGFGRNPDRFGRGGALEEIAQRSERWPSWLLVGDQNTAPWFGYDLILEAGHEFGGSGCHRRRLYRRRE